ncbi:MAG TPA: hypothetical protein VF365_06445 [Candidatus Limnocylindria bacterium]
MTHSIRSILALTILAIVLVACGTTIGAPISEAPEPSQPAAPSADPSVAPSEAPVEPSKAPVKPSEAPADEEREIAGIITMAEMAYSGPGGTIQEALDLGPTGNELPTLVNGVLFQDADGTIYLATSISDTAAPTFEGPMLKVLNMPNDGPSWDMAYAEDTLLEEANGILFRQNAQVLGFLELP